MRVHALSATAFGPFAETVSVDFDALSDAGLFLLTGPTGAGKSSILDAVCFALYGSVPGDRSAARRLRCDLAPPDRPPRVFLDVSLAGRRFHLTRSPAWQRPKKRGTGLTTEQASVLVEEIVEGGTVHLTNRLDEAGQLIGDLLGMNVGQFTQVVMLPQGRFQDFLRARSEERHRLLQQLFRTRRFELVETWLRERRTTLRRASAHHADRVRALVHRIDEVGELPLEADDLDDATLAGLAGDDGLTSWARQVVAHAEEQSARAAAELRTATRAADGATTALADGRELEAQQARHREATATDAALDARAEEVTALRDRVEAARRAAPVMVVHQQLRRVEQRRRLAAEKLDHTMATAGTTAHLDPAADLDRARTALADARALLPAEAELTDVRAQLATATEGADARRRRVDELAARDAAVPAQLRVAAEAARRSREAAEQQLVLGDQLDDLVELDGRHRARTELADGLASARERLREAVDEHQRRRQRWLELHELRLAGIAAELAGSLAAGGSCPVCGSCEHPHRATAAPGTPGADDEKAARRAAEDADVARQAHDDRVRGLESELVELSARLDDRPAEQVSQDLATTRERLRELGPRAETRDADAAELERTEAEAQDVGKLLATARAELAAQQAARSALATRAEAAADRLSVALHEHRDVGALVHTRERVVVHLEALVHDVEENRAAEQALAQAQHDLAHVATDAGFDDPDSALAAHLPDRQVAAHQASIDEHDRDRVAVIAVLGDEAVRAAATQQAPDLEELSQRHERTGRERSVAEGNQRVAEERARRARRLCADLLAALYAWAPVRREHEVASAVAGFAEGRSVDNAWQMRFSAYVLSWRLGQVVAAANERLQRMSDHRYTLEHTVERGARETRGGLSLRVIDDWSGEARDPVTLSGGETFVVSLALALGLSDVVSREAGGRALGTLFVDEGFGSLDPDTLDDVMDTLDELREGGRVVGIVSHVDELRGRVPAQLRVSKSRTGSTLATTGVDGTRVDGTGVVPSLPRASG